MLAPEILPGSHRYVEAPDADRVELEPLQIDEGVADTVIVGGVQDVVPLKTISSILTPLPLLQGRVHLSLKVVDAMVPKFHVPALIYGELPVGVVEVNVLELQVAPLSVEYSTKQGLFVPEPYVATLKVKVKFM